MSSHAAAETVWTPRTRKEEAPRTQRNAREQEAHAVASERRAAAWAWRVAAAARHGEAGCGRKRRWRLATAAGQPLGLEERPPWPRSQQPWKELAAHPTTPRRAANRAAGEPKGRCHASRPRWPTPPTVARHSTQRSLLHCCMHALAAIATIFQREQLADVLEDAARARELSRETNRRRLE